MLYKVECESCGIIAEHQEYKEARDVECLHRTQTGHDPIIIQE